MSKGPQPLPGTSLTEIAIVDETRTLAIQVAYVAGADRSPAALAFLRLLERESAGRT